MKRHRHILLVTLLTGIVIALAMAISQTRAGSASTAGHAGDAVARAR